MSDRPNIIHIHSDSMDGRVIGCAGHPAAHTPNLDRLASEGVLFSNAYCNDPVCCPSRASMRSGLYVHHCEAWNNYKGLEPNTPTYDAHMAAGGYRVEDVGRKDYLSGGHTIRARVDAWTSGASINRPAYNEPPPRVVDENTDRIATYDWKRTDEAVQWLKEHAAEPGPFKLYLGFGAPHPPYVTSKTYLDMIDESKVTMPSLEEPSHPVAQYQWRHKNWPYGFDEKMVRTVRRLYYAMIAEVDAMVGEVMGAVSDLGLENSTVVIVTSDHGDLAMEHRQYYKMSPYEGSVRVPMVARGPGMLRGVTVERPVTLVDLYPTFLDLGGIDHPEGLDGHTLADMLYGRPDSHPDTAFSEFHGVTSNASWFMLRRDDWKYIHYDGYEPELFNLRDDPEELHNLAAADTVTADDMREALESIVDTDEVSAYVRAYDKKSFRVWREEELRKGTYRQTMAEIFSGFDHLTPDMIRPWTDEDEKHIEEWLNG